MKLYSSNEILSKQNKYKLYDDLFTGDNKVLASDKYLPYHELEKDTSVKGATQIRATRENLSRYTNFAKRALRRYQSIIFQNEIEFNDDAKKFLLENNLYYNIDGKGTDIDSFIRNKLFRNKFIYGDSYLLTVGEDDSAVWDTPSAMTVKDISIQSGKITLFRYEYEVSSPRVSSREEEKVFIYSDEYFLFEDNVFRNRYKKEKSKENKNYGDEWELMEENILIENFDNIPVAFSFGSSFIDEPANDILEYHNIKSSLLNQLYHQAFQKIIVTGNVDEKQAFAFSEFTVNIIRTTDGTPANVTVISPTDTTALRQQLNEAGQNVFKSFYHYNRSISSDSGNIESAESQELAKEDLINVIKTEIADLEKQINKGLNDLALQLGVLNFKGEAVISKEINIANLDQALKEELAYLETVRTNYPLWFKAVMKKVAKRQNLENEEAILEEIENKELQNNNLIGLENQSNIIIEE